MVANKGAQMSLIQSKIDKCILYFLKLHKTTAEDLVLHLSASMTDTQITQEGICARLQTLQEEEIIEYNHIDKTWMIYGKQTTPAILWSEIVLQKQLHMQDMANLSRQHKIHESDAINAIGILEANGITHVSSGIVKPTVSEAQFLKVRISQ
jgi:hypothetical protein